jgi:hypothetical protein
VVFFSSQWTTENEDLLPIHTLTIKQYLSELNVSASVYLMYNNSNFIVRLTAVFPKLFKVEYFYSLFSQ